MEKRRSTDKIEPLKIIISIIPIIFSAIILYIIFPMESRLTKRIETLEAKSERQIENIYNFSQSCKDEINNIRKETTEKIIAIKDQLIAMINKIDNKDQD